MRWIERLTRAISALAESPGLDAGDLLTLACALDGGTYGERFGPDHYQTHLNRVKRRLEVVGKIYRTNLEAGHKIEDALELLEKRRADALGKRV